MQDHSSTDLKPPLVFRVGVTGHRRLAPEAIGALQAEIRARLAQIKAKIEACAATPEAAAVYARAGSGAAAARLRVVSPLAEGADRLVAREARRLGAELDVPLPFPQAQYEEDFPESVDDFRRLLDGARAFTLDGVRDGGYAQAESYEAAGQFVARNSDLLIAVWDGQRVRGAGGTAEIVGFAIEIGTPVWWIDAGGQGAPRLLRGARDVSGAASGPSGEAAIAALERLVERAALPPPARPAEGDAFAAAIEAGGRRFRPEHSPLETFLAETPPLPRWPWRVHAGLRTLAARSPDREGRRLVEPVSPEERYWRARFDVADRASSAYADRYRSSYVWIALLAVIALVAAAFSAEFPERAVRLASNAFEVVALLAILGLVFANHVERWHEKWISYRLLAELCRKQFAFAPIGRSLPGSEVARLSFDSEEARRARRDTWVAWYFLASLRGAAFPQGEMAKAESRAMDIGRSLIAEQVDFHRARRRAMHAVAKTIDAAAYILFGATLAIAIARLAEVVFLPARELTLWDLAGALLSASAGALVALRAYAEFPMLARQSAFMLRVLGAAREELDAAETNVGKPLGSRALAQALEKTAAAMMQDITGWAHLFRIKTIEAN